ncbi:MAG: nuclear transport factor 2 family protein [Acidimicrobiales bacterium]
MGGGEASEPERVARELIAAFGANDLDALRAVLADDFVGHITTADAGTRHVGADEYVAGVAAMDVATADLRLDVPDVTAIDGDTVLVMVEVHAARRQRSLHNFSGQLLRVRAGKVVSLWMVDAKPAESDSFWSA